LDNTDKNVINWVKIIEGMVRKINQKMNEQSNIMLLNKKLNVQNLIINKDLKPDSFLIKNTSQINITDKNCGLFEISESIEDEE